MIKDVKQIFELLDHVVEEIVKDNVTQAVTDNTLNYMTLGRILEEKRTKLFWSYCVVLCLDLIFEDIS